MHITYRQSLQTLDAGAVQKRKMPGQWRWRWYEHNSLDWVGRWPSFNDGRNGYSWPFGLRAGNRDAIVEQCAREPPRPGGVRLVIALSVAAAVTVMIGAILMAASVVMRMVTKHQPAHMTRLGLDVVAAGIAFRPGGPGGVRHRGGSGERGRSRPRGGPGGSPSRRPPVPNPRPPAGHGPVTGARQGPGPARCSAGRCSAGRRSAGAVPSGAGAQRGGAPSAGGPRRGATAAARVSGRPPVLNPTGVYSPGGLIDMPGDVRAPGTPGGQDIPEILRTAGTRSGSWRAGSGGSNRRARPGPAALGLGRASAAAPRLPARNEPGRPRLAAPWPGRPAGAHATP